MNNKKDFIEGMGSIYDISGENHFNEFKHYPGVRVSIRDIWRNVGCHINNSVTKLSKETGLSSNADKRKPVYGKR